VAFTNITAVAGLFPSWQRGTPSQKPSDTIAQQFIDDIADVIFAILERRFNEAISGVGTSTAWLTSLGLPDIKWYPNFPVAKGDIVVDNNDPMSAQQAQNPGSTGTTPPSFSSAYGVSIIDGGVTWMNIAQSRQFRVLERGNRYGAAAQLGVVLAAYGVKNVADLADEYAKTDWEPFKRELNAENKDGKPLPYGPYDYLFDPEASVQTPRPLLQFVAGGDMPVGVAPAQEGLGVAFSKWGIDFGRHSPGYWSPGTTL